MRYRNLILVVTTLLFCGCVTVATNYMADRSQRMPLKPVSITMDSDVYLLRVDLVRNTTTEEINIFTGRKKDIFIETVNVPYHYLGIRLGNGIFLDLNENLCVDLIEFYNIDKNAFRIVKKNNTVFFDSIDYQSANNIFTRRQNIFFVIPHITSAEIETNRIKVTEGIFFKNKLEILKSENEISCSADGGVNRSKRELLINQDKIVRHDDNVYEMKGSMGYSIFTKVDDNNILYKSSHFTKNGDELIFEYNPLFGRNIYHFFRTKNGFVFHDENYQGVIVEKNENKISISSITYSHGKGRIHESTEFLIFFGVLKAS